LERVSSDLFLGCLLKPSFAPKESPQAFDLCNTLNKIKNMDALQLRDNAKQQLAEIKTIETGIDYLNKVKAIETWAKAEKKDAELQNMIAEQKIRTQRILGNLLKESEIGKAGYAPMKKVESNNTTPPQASLSDFGITKDQSSTFQKIASLPEEIFEQEIAVAKEETTKRIELTTSRMLNAAKEYEHEKKKADAEISERDKMLIQKLKAGNAVVVNQKTDLATIRYAEMNGLYVRADRFSDWGNPFEMGKDGNRSEVCDNYENHYLPFKPSILKKINDLKGRALGCWCAPERCHCDTLIKLIK
jgi:hypothetical protein